MITLEGTRVLLVAPRFFGYEREIREEIERRGAIVDWLPDRPFDTPVMAAIAKFNAEWLQPAADLVYDRLLNQFGATEYAYILVINGQTLSRRMLMRLRFMFPTAKTILYMWDSMDNRPSILRNLSLFDSAFSFDPLCARKFGMVSRALFFSKGFEQSPHGEDHEYQVSFIGTAHSDRYAVVSEIKSHLPSSVSAFWYLYLQAPWVFHVYRAAKPRMRSAKREEFHFTPLGKRTVQSVFAKSRTVLDIEHPKQRGLTMRTFETLGARKKLATTNQSVVDYDFFLTGNVYVVDRNFPRLPESFLEAPFIPYPNDIIRRYSLAGWIDEVLGGAN